MASNEPVRLDDLTRPIIGIENRTPQEVFDIMADRIRARHRTLSQADGQREVVVTSACLNQHEWSYMPTTGGISCIRCQEFRPYTDVEAVKVRAAYEALTEVHQEKNDASI